MFTVLALTLLTGCARTVGTYEIAAPVAAPAAPAPTAREEADALWTQRGDKEKLLAALAKYKALHEGNPQDRQVTERLVRGWYFLGDGHETEKEAKMAAWATAIAYGKQCLALNAEFKGLLGKGDETEETAGRAFTKEDVPCVYWTSSALGKWAKADGLVTTLKHIGTVKAWMKRVGELEPDFYFSGPDRYWAAVYAASPSFAGQDLGKSRELFDKAIAAHPTFLGHHVLLAEMWATKSQDKKTFQEKLNWVLAQPVDVIPDLQPEMEAEQRKARALLAAEGDFFAN
jgi:hypothetical protein